MGVFVLARHDMIGLTRRLLITALWVICSVLAPSLALGQDSPRGNRVEFTRGPVISGSRVVALGGAYIGLADSADGHLINPASIAMRARHTADDWFDWDFAFTLASFTGADGIELELTNTDADYDAALLFDLGLNLKFFEHGVAFHVYAHDFDVPVCVQTDMNGSCLEQSTVEVQSVTGGLGYAFTVLDNQLSGGAVLVPLVLDITDPDSGEDYFEASGVGGLFGLLWSPNPWPFRIGLTFRTPITSDDFEGRAPDFFTTVRPREVVMPWELGLGASVLLFAEQPLNPKAGWNDDEDDGDDGADDDGASDEGESDAGVQNDEAPEREPREDGPTLLVAADVRITGSSEGAVPLASVISQEIEPAGNDVTVAAHLGLESELVPSWFRVRAGTYMEPPRVPDVDPRFHVTGGVDVKIPLWLDWRLNGMIDWAPGYLNWGVGVGLWH